MRIFAALLMQQSMRIPKCGKVMDIVNLSSSTKSESKKCWEEDFFYVNTLHNRIIIMQISNNLFSCSNNHHLLKPTTMCERTISET